MFTVQLLEAASVAPQVLLKIAKSPGLVPPIVRLETVIAVVLPFVSVTTFWPLLFPSATLPQLRLAGETEALPGAGTAIPDRATDCGLFVPESTKASVALRVPFALGLKTMLALQLVEADRLAPHVVDKTAKSAAFTPAIVMLLMEIEVLPASVSETTCAALLDPTVVLVNERLPGFTEALLETATADPESATDWGLLVAPSVKTRVAVRVPPAFGLNTTEAEQLPDAARLVPQVVAETVKSAAFAPAMPTLPIEIGAERPLNKVADCATLAAPTAVVAKVMLEGPTATLPPGAMPGPLSATTCGLLVSES